MLRENTPKPAMNILEAAISQSLLIGQRFGIITSGWGYKYIHYTEVRNFLGATSERFAGLVTCELGVLEFQSGERAHVEARVKAAAAKSASQGADVIILGCAGTNMKRPSRRYYLMSKLVFLFFRNGWYGRLGATRSKRSRFQARSSCRWCKSWSTDSCRTGKVGKINKM
jgi:hypothetical protein